jgi:hypothetical protein
MRMARPRQHGSMLPEGINEMDPPLCGSALMSHNEVVASL